MHYFALANDRLPQTHYEGIEHFTGNGRCHPTRTTKEWVMYAMLEGTLDIESGGKRVILTAGTVRFFPPDEFQKCHTQTACRYLYLHFDAELTPLDCTEEELRNRITEAEKRRFATPWYVWQRERIYLPEEFHPENVQTVIAPFSGHLPKMADGGFGKHYYLGLKTAECFFLLARLYEATLFSQSEIGNDIAQKTLRYLETHFTEKITGPSLEEAVGYSFDYLGRKFRTTFGITVFAYLTELRIKEAKRLLYTQNSPISAVAIACGFGDAYYFSKIFRKKVGMTPTAYRKQNIPIQEEGSR